MEQAKPSSQTIVTEQTDTVFEEYPLFDCSIDYMDGKLVFDIDECGNAILVDYIGTSEVLVIPSNINYNDVLLPVSYKIPDCSFSSCNNIKYVVVGLGETEDQNELQFGSCVFENCKHLELLIAYSKSLLHNSILIDEYSFYRNVRIIKIAAGEIWEASRYLGDFYVPDPWVPEYTECADRYDFAESTCDFCDIINSQMLAVIDAWIGNGNIDRLLSEMARYGNDTLQIVLTNHFCKNTRDDLRVHTWVADTYKQFRVIRAPVRCWGYEYVLEI